jgi:hypothetical protein
MQTKINIVDALTGTGKTSALINYINASDSDTKFLYITPFLTEVERIIKQCPSKAFKQPEKMGTKKKGIKYLLERGINIVSTHSLFQQFDQELTELAFSNNYILVMDEVADVIDTLQITQDDLATILEKYTEITEDHLLRWTATKYEGRFSDYKRMCDLGCLGIYGGKVILWLFPISTFKGFKEIFILTYMFESQIQKYYFDFYNLDYNYLWIKENRFGEYNTSAYELTDEAQNYGYSKYKDLVQIIDNEKMNHIGKLNYSLSSGWYERHKENKLMRTLKNNLLNFFRNITKTNSNLNLWTTFKDYRHLISGKGYTKGYLASNARATNDYRDRTAVAYCINKFMNPYIKNFFITNNIKIDEDAFSLSEMIQWIFRSAIRKGEAIQAYIPSKRMRELLIDWVDNL